MTLPSSGTITLSQIRAEFNGPTPINLEDYYRGGSYVPNSSYTSNIPTSGAISLESFYGAANIVPGNSGILTTGASYTLPATSGTSIKVLVIGGGGGGGGGSSRDQNWSWGIYGGAGGGAGGNAYNTIGVIPGSTLTFFIGSAGAAGSPRDGPYSGGNSGSSGGTTVLYYSGVAYAQASGGAGGLVSQATAATSPGSALQGSAILTPQYGGGSPGGNTGGVGGNSYTIDTRVGASFSDILIYGNQAAAGQPNSGSTAGNGANLGGGGGGGGNNEANNDAGCIPGNGSAGAVFIWWGY